MLINYYAQVFFDRKKVGEGIGGSRKEPQYRAADWCETYCIFFTLGVKLIPTQCFSFPCDEKSKKSMVVAREKRYTQKNQCPRMKKMMKEIREYCAQKWNVRNMPI